MRRPNSRTETRGTAALVVVLLAVATVAAYWPVLGADFVNIDDELHVTGNPHVIGGLTAANVAWAFANSYAGVWIPLSWLSHMADCTLYGLRPAGHHVTNLVLHVLNATLLLVLLRRLTGALLPSAAVAALFALHPLQVESVAWVTERKDVLSVFFGFLALLTYARYAEESRARRLVPVAVSFVLSLMAKPMLVTLPFVLLLLDYWPLGRWTNTKPTRLIAEKLPLFVIAGAVGAGTIVLAHREDAITSLGLLPVQTRVANALVAYPAYVWKALWPTRLAVFYPMEVVPTSEVAGAVAFLVLVIAAALWIGRRRPHVLVGVFWFLVTLLPVIGLVQAGDQARADRFTYFPLVGLFVAVLWSARRAWPLAVVALCACAVATRTQATYWQSSETLFARALEVTENNWLAHNNLGDALLRRGEIGLAKSHFETALALKPRYVDARYNLGVALALEGRTPDAAAQFAEALRLDPKHNKSRYNLGLALMLQGRLDEAIALFDEAVRRDPEYADAHANLGTALDRRGRPDEARAHLAEAVRLNPTNPVMQYNLGLSLESAGRVDEAIRHYTRATELNPGFAEARDRLGAARAAGSR